MADKVLDILEEYSNKLVEALQDSLRANGRYASGTSAQTIVAMPVKVMGQKLVMEIRMADYLEYVDKGVSGTLVKYNTEYSYKNNGKRIPIKAMKKHLANRGITPKPLKVGKRKGLKSSKKSPKQRALDSTAFAMSTALKRKGLKPTHFIDEALDGGLAEEMNKKLLAALGQEIAIEIIN